MKIATMFNTLSISKTFVPNAIITVYKKHVNMQIACKSSRRSPGFKPQVCYSSSADSGASASFCR